MTPAEQNRAIAEWMGWTKEKLDAWEDWMLAHQQMQWGEISTEEFYRRHLRVDPLPTAPPNFHGDLNACWEFEEKLTMIQARSYANSLRDSVNIDSFCGLHTTAPQRYKALLKTLGLWKEGE